MSNHYYVPTGPAESLRTREFAEEEWSRLVLNVPRDKSSFLMSLKEVNDRIIGLKVSLPPLQSPASNQESPKDYGFVVDSNMRVASASSLSTARHLRENLIKIMASAAVDQAHNSSIQNRFAGPALARPTNAHTNFDILSSASLAGPPPIRSSRTYNRESTATSTDGYSQQQNAAFQCQEQTAVQESTAQDNAKFTKLLKDFRNSIAAPAPTHSEFAPETLNQTESEQKDKSAIVEYESEQEEMLDEQVEEVEEEEVEIKEERSDSADLTGLTQTTFPARVPLPAPMPSKVPGPVSTSAPRLPVPATAPSSADATVVPTQVQEAAPVELKPDEPTQSISSRSEPAVLTGAATTASTTKTASAATANAKANSSVSSETASEPAPSVEKISDATEPVKEADRLLRLQAWERELQEREQKVLEYMNSLSRPLGAQDRVRRERADASPLRSSAEIHIHNHIAPSPIVASQGSLPGVPTRSSYYESSTWQPSAYAPLKYDYNNTATSATKPYTTAATEEVRPPSVQMRLPQRSPYAFPPAPYSSLGSGRGTVDLSGLSLERMRELTGHY